MNRETFSGGLPLSHEHTHHLIDTLVQTRMTLPATVVDKERGRGCCELGWGFGLGEEEVRVEKWGLGREMKG